MAKVYSLTPFFNENDIFEIRLATLDDVVDYHVVVEARQTHSGKEKPLNFDLKRFRPWENKILYAASNLAGETDWAREKEQRKSLWHAMPRPKPDDLILLSDLDEIPHPDAVRKGNPKQPHILLCRMHVGKLNYRWKTEAHESHSICRIFPAYMIGRQLDNLEEARLTHMEPVGPPGWHLSWMQGYGDKLSAFVHQEMVPFARPDLAAQGGPLFPQLVKQEIEKCDLKDLPPYVQEHQERFAHLIA